MNAPWTVRSMAKWMADDFAGRGLDSPRLDAELLLAHGLGCDRMGLYLDLDRPLDTAELDGIRALVKRRRAREPVAYILGEREFVGRSFEVGTAVLIPRPDTETLVDRALALLEPETDARLADVCTGSGCIAITLAAARPGCQVDATDLSEDALLVAHRNAARHDTDARVRFLAGDLLAALPEGERYALIACNPPYVTQAQWAGLDADVRDHEPRLALVGGDDGLEMYRRLAPDLPGRLQPGGRVLLEVGMGQAPAVSALLQAAGLIELQVHEDLGGIERVVEARLAD